MDVLDLINNRRSVRSYKKHSVEWEKLADVLDAGRMAPSSGNLQDWKFILVTDSKKKSDIMDACAGQIWMEEAPVFIVLISLDERNERYYGERGKNVYTIQNCAAAAMSMILAAESQGLATCWVSAFDPSSIARILTVPSTCTPQVVLTLGYADEKADIPSKLALNEVVFFDKYGGRISDITEASNEYSVRIKRELDEIKGFLSKKQMKDLDKFDDKEHP